MEESKWWRLACQELMLDLYDEHAVLRTKASIHRNQFCIFIIRIEIFAIQEVTPAPTLQSFIRQFVKIKVIRECFLKERNVNIGSLDAAFYTQIPKVWLKKEVSKLFRNLLKSNSLADYLRKCIEKARIPLENATCSAKSMPYARNITDLKVLLGTRTKLLTWFSSRIKIPSKRLGEETLP